jgi:predicted transcriptional regulator
MSRMTIDLSNEVDDRLSEIARKSGITKAEAMRRAFALLSVAYDEKERGNSLAVVDDKMRPVARLIGVY